MSMNGWWFYVLPGKFDFGLDMIVIMNMNVYLYNTVMSSLLTRYKLYGKYKCLGIV